MIRILISLAMLFSFAWVNYAHANTQAADKSALFGLNQASPNMMAEHALGTKVIKQSSRLVYATFDSNVSGKGPGALAMRDSDGRPVYLPKGAFLTECYLIVGTAIANVSGTGTTIKLDLGTQSILASITSAPVSISGCAATPTYGSYPSYVSAAMATADAAMVATVSSASGKAYGVTGKVTAVLRYDVGPN